MGFCCGRRRRRRHSCNSCGGYGGGHGGGHDGGRVRPKLYEKHMKKVCTCVPYFKPVYCPIEKDYDSCHHSMKKHWDY